MVIKLSALINVGLPCGQFQGLFNSVNLVLIDKVKGAHVLMNTIISFTEHLKPEDDELWAQESLFL